MSDQQRPDAWGQPGPQDPGPYDPPSGSHGAGSPPPPPPGWYAGPGHPQPAGPSPLAVTALVTGILSVLGACFCWFAPVLPIVAVVTGFLGKGQVDREPQRYTGRAMAWWGIGLGAVALLLSVVLAVLFVVLGVSDYSLV